MFSVLEKTSLFLFFYCHSTYHPTKFFLFLLRHPHCERPPSLLSYTAGRAPAAPSAWDTDPEH